MLQKKKGKRERLKPLKHLCVVNVLVCAKDRFACARLAPMHKVQRSYEIEMYKKDVKKTVYR